MTITASVTERETHVQGFEYGTMNGIVIQFENGSDMVKVTASVQNGDVAKRISTTVHRSIFESLVNLYAELRNLKPIKSDAEDAAVRIGNVRIDELELSSRVVGALSRSGIKTVGQLVGKSHGELVLMKGLGKVRVGEILAIITSLGLTLKPDVYRHKS